MFEKLGNKGTYRRAVLGRNRRFPFIALYFFSAVTAPRAVLCVCGSFPVLFCGFNTAIYAIVPDCVEYGEWKTGVRNDGFQYAFVSLGNKLGMAIGTSALAGVLGAFAVRAQSGAESCRADRHALGVFADSPVCCGS